MTGSRPNPEETTAAAGPGETPGARVEAGGDVIAPGANIGRYLVIEELGRGGMGYVLRAYDPKLQREVALKRVRTGLVGDEARARMVREARAMARLAHPNVVAVFDAELDDKASVVLVMEYVPGTTLAQWLDEAPRTWKDIVQVFVAAGRGLRAAHAEGILHRDFKPDNVLIGTDGRARVTDFGLARASGAASGDSGPAASDTGAQGRVQTGALAGELTEEGQVMGTPLYMAPEQHEAGELDANADQYAFCVALWRALTGEPPFFGQGIELWKAKYAGPPKWPRHSPIPRHIEVALRRGLDPHPGRRWTSMDALLEELQSDPSRRRMRLLAVGGVAVAGVAALGWQRVQRVRALDSCAEEADQIAQTWNPPRAGAIEAAFASSGVTYAAQTWKRARVRLDEYAQSWRALREGVCQRADMEASLDENLALASRTCLDEQRAQLEALLQQFADPNPGTVQRAGTATAWLPQPSTCADEDRLRARGRLLADPDQRERIVDLQLRLSRAAVQRVMGEYGPSEAEVRDVLDRAEAADLRPLVAEAKLSLGRVFDAVGRSEDARSMLEDAFIEGGALGQDDTAMEAGLLLVFVLGNRLGRHEEALTWGRLTQMLAERLGRTNDLAYAGLLDSLGNVRTGRGEYDEALALHERALALQESIVGTPHPQVAVSLNSIGTVYQEKHDYPRALQFHTRALQMRREVLGPEHPHVAGSLNNLARAYRSLGEDDQALALLEEGLTITEKTVGADSPRIVGLLNNIGEIHRMQGDLDRAKSRYDAAMSILATAFGDEHRDIATVADNLGLVMRAKGDLEAAIGLHQRSLDIRRNLWGSEHVEVSLSRHLLGRALLESGRAADALPQLETALSIRTGHDVLAADLAASRFEVARALVSTGGDRQRAVELATAARDALHALDAGTMRTAERSGQVPTTAEVDRWLAEPAPVTAP